MKAKYLLNILFTILLGNLTPLALASELNLPSNLELVSQDSNYITLRNRDNGITDRIYFPEGSMTSPGWIPTIADDTTSCYRFDSLTTVGYLSSICFSDYNRNGRTELVGNYGWYIRAFEYTGQNSFVQIYSNNSLLGAVDDIGHDIDGDGYIDMVTSKFDSLSYSTMRIYSSQSLTGFPGSLQFQQQAEVLRSPMICDIDLDGKLEITYNSVGRNILIWKSPLPGQYIVADTIPVRHFLDEPNQSFRQPSFGDFDRDGKGDMAIGSIFGDVLVCEDTSSGNDKFAPVWNTRLSTLNMDYAASAEDMDGDGWGEFILMSRQPWIGGYTFYVFEADGNNSYHEAYRDSLPGNTITYAGIKAFDLDGDGIEELAFSTNSYIAIYKAFGNDDYIRIFLTSIEGQGKIYAFDATGDGWGELYYPISGPDNQTRVYTFRGDFPKGDANCDCSLTLADVLFLLNYFKGVGPRPAGPMVRCDVNGDCLLNGLDVTYFVNYFQGGPTLIECR